MLVFIIFNVCKNLCMYAATKHRNMATAVRCLRPKLVIILNCISRRVEKFKYFITSHSI